MKRAIVALIALGLCGALPTMAQERIGYNKFSFSRGNLLRALDEGDQFGTSMASLGDLDGDGFEDIAVGAPGDDDGGEDRGAVWILFLEHDEPLVRVKARRKISQAEGWAGASLSDNDAFGRAVAGLPDLDGDAVPELAVAAAGDDEAGLESGAVWILFLTREGSVKSHWKICAGCERPETIRRSLPLWDGFRDAAAGDHGTYFGSSIVLMDEEDGKARIAVAAPYSLFLNGVESGLAWTFSLHPQDDSGAGGWEVDGVYSPFAQDPSGLGPQTPLHTTALAVAQFGTTQILMWGNPGGFAFSGGPQMGSIVPGSGFIGLGAQPVSSGSPGGLLTGSLNEFDRFGTALVDLGDVDGDGHPDIAVSAVGFDRGRGAVWILSFDGKGVVAEQRFFDDRLGILDLTEGDSLGTSLLPLTVGGTRVLLVGGVGADAKRGAIWLLKLSSQESLGIESVQEPALTGGEGENLGSAIANLGLLEGSTYLAIGKSLANNVIAPQAGDVVAAPIDDLSNASRIPTVAGQSGNWDSGLLPGARFGSALAPLFGLDDGCSSNALVAIGVPGANISEGGIWTAFVCNSVVNPSHNPSPDFYSPDGVEVGDEFGASISYLGPNPRSAETVVVGVGAPGDDDVWLVDVGIPSQSYSNPRRVSELEPDGLGCDLGVSVEIQGPRVKKLTDVLPPGSRFGASLTSLGSRDDGSGAFSLFVGEPSTGPGAVWMLTTDGERLTKCRRISNLDVGNALADGDKFGSAVAYLGEVILQNSSYLLLAVGATGDNSGCEATIDCDYGAMWLLLVDDSANVVSADKIGIGTPGGLSAGALTLGSRFGSAISIVTRSDPTTEFPTIAVGSQGYEDGRGAAWIMTLVEDRRIGLETIVGQNGARARLGGTDGSFGFELDSGGSFGRALASGDFNLDGWADLLIGSVGKVSIAYWEGAVAPSGGLSLKINDVVLIARGADSFGSSVANLGAVDHDGEMYMSLAVGVPGIADNDNGSVKLLLLDQAGNVCRSDGGTNACREYTLTDGAGGLNRYGSSVVRLGDLSGDGTIEIAVGAPGSEGAVWVHSWSPETRTIVEQTKISNGMSGLPASLIELGDDFGASLASLGQLDGTERTAVAVGAPGDESGAVWILFLDQGARVTHFVKLCQECPDGPVPPTLGPNGGFGTAIANLGNIDSDDETATVILVSAVGDDGATGSVWQMYLRSDGTVKSYQQLNSPGGPFIGVVGSEDSFGGSLAAGLRHRIITGKNVFIGAPGDGDGGSRRGAVWELFVNTPPVIVASAPTEPVLEETALTVSTPIRDDGSVEAHVNIRRSGDSKFLSVRMDRVNSAYEFRVPESLVQNRGLEYFVTATDANGAVSVSDTFSVRVRVPDPGIRKSSALVHGIGQAAYRLISFPLEIEESSREDVLEDDMGGYDGTRWRLFEAEVGTSTIETVPSTLIEPGKAFWIITKDPNRLIDSGAGTSLATRLPFRIAVEPGWNYIGNPYNFDIPEERLWFNEFDGPLADDDGSVRILKEVMSYTGDWIRVDTLRAFEGYALFSSHSDTLLIDPDLSEGPVTRPGKNLDAEVATGGSRKFHWSIKVSAAVQEARDATNFAAVAEGADAGWDPLDRPEPPTIGEYVSIYFPHGDWKRTATRYRTDTRPVPDLGEIWTFEVTTTVQDKVTLLFDHLDTVPSDYQVWLVDDVAGISQDLRVSNSYEISGSIKPHPLSLVVGTPTFIRSEGLAVGAIPTDYVLDQNFPNPFNPTTTIRFGLPTDGAVTLVIYDILGKRVAVLEDETHRKAGYHTLVWDGRSSSSTPVASGVYLVQLRAESFVETRKMVLVK